MKASPYPKNNVEVAQDFFEDASDLVLRFDRTFDDFSPIKTRRFKCFNDLRLAYECILKAIVAYRQPRDMERKALIAVVERHKHNISSLENAILSTDGDRFGVEVRGAELDQLPIGLRYALDGKDFREAKEMEYYQTIGSDLWLHRLRVYIAGVRDSVGAALGKEGGIISPGDITMEMLFEKKYNKFRE
jgi:hypothetical protein